MEDQETFQGNLSKYGTELWLVFHPTLLWVEWFPPKQTVEVLTLVPVNMTLFRNRVFADVR